MEEREIGYGSEELERERERGMEEYRDGIIKEGEERQCETKGEN